MTGSYYRRASQLLQASINNPPATVTIRQFHWLFYNNARSTWFRNRWFGIRAQQNPNDVWIIQEIISETKPDFIIETGTLCGGSALLWASILEVVNPAGRVITIDLDDSTAEACRLPLFQRKVDFMQGSSTDPAIVGRVAKRAKGCKVLVILDSDHHKAHVLKEMQCYAPMVQVGGYLIVQDSDINGNPVQQGFGPGPKEALEEYLNTNHNFLPDKSRERLLFTMHPNGYLKRIRAD
jgi:cephalosporin hydroxylase